jgi:DNA-binding transcriptional ArsR family regulator
MNHCKVMPDTYERYEAITMSATAADSVVLITNEDDIYNASHSLKAMAHPLRLKILCLLGATTEVSVQDIVEQVGTSQSNISQHLSILRDKGILVSRKDANKVYYRIAEPSILHLISAMRSAFCSNFSS